MSKLNINPFDTRDLITQSKNLNSAQQKEAQIARLALNQGMMPVLGDSENFVMLSNGSKAIFLNSKTMKEDAFVAGLVQVGRGAGLTSDEVLSSYTSDSASMALCNAIQKAIREGYKAKSERAVNETLEFVARNTELFGDVARKANVDLGVIVAVEQQLKRDVAQLKEYLNEKSDISGEEKE